MCCVEAEANIMPWAQRFDPCNHRSSHARLQNGLFLQFGLLLKPCTGSNHQDGHLQKDVLFQTCQQDVAKVRSRVCMVCFFKRRVDRACRCHKTQPPLIGCFGCRISPLALPRPTLHDHLPIYQGFLGTYRNRNRRPPCAYLIWQANHNKAESGLLLLIGPSCSQSGVLRASPVVMYPLISHSLRALTRC